MKKFKPSHGKRNGRAREGDPRKQLQRCLTVVRAALQPEQRRLVTGENLHERISELIAMSSQLAAARQAAGALKNLGLT